MESPDIKIYKEIFQCVDKYTGLPDCHNARYQFLPYPQRLYVLSEMLKLHVLRELGDIKLYLKLDAEMRALPEFQSSSSNNSTRDIVEWLDTNMDAAHAPKTVSTREKVVISVLVWGENYANKMLNRAFKSMMAQGNIPAMVISKYVIMHIQTDEKTKAIIEAAPIVKQMAEAGVHFEYIIFSDAISASLSDEVTKWWMVGAAASLAIHYAKRSQAAFHHSYPDVVYSDKYFSELIRLSAEHNSILGQAHRADESILLPNLAYYESEGKLQVPAADLAAHHLNSVHMGMFSLMVNNRSKFWTYPQSHVIIWEGAENLHFNCPHLNIMWLGSQVLKGLQSRYYMTLDSELDLICKGDDFYIPQEMDEIYLLEFSEQCKGQVEDIYTDAQSLGNYIWSRITHRDVLKFFVRGMKTKINRTIRPMPKNVLPENQISAEKNYLFNAIISTDPYIGVKLARQRTHEGRIFAFV